MIELRDALVAAGLDEAGIAAAFGPAPNSEAGALYLRRAGESSGRAALVRLFVLGQAVPVASLPVDAGELEQAGLVERSGENVRAPLRLTPFEGLLFAHDGDERLHEAGYVTGVNNASRTLAALTVREPVERALDLGTGCGVQALLAAKRARVVVATDVNPRSLEQARLNARLNGFEIDVREGSWFDPVGDETFDLIVSNPPFVISPDAAYVFRDSGLAGDSVSRNVVTGAAKHLQEGGFATILCNWVCSNPKETWQPLAQWVQGSGCDALLLAHEAVDVFHYAARWNEPLRHDPNAFAAAIDRWLDYYRQNEIAAIGIGAVVLRHRTGANWCRGFDLTVPATGEAGRHLLRLFAATDAPLEDDGKLLAARLRLIPGHRLDQSLTYDGEYQLNRVSMVLADGVGLVGTVDATALPVLFALDPARSLGEVIAETASRAPDVLPTIRRLYGLGMLDRV